MTVPVVGTTLQSGPATIGKEEIVAFAEMWDPRPIHLTGVESHELFDGVVASGLHILSIAFRQAYDLGIDRKIAMAGLGFREVRFRSPLRAGATVRTDVTVMELRPTSRAGSAVLTLRFVLRDEDQTALMEATLDELVSHGANEFAPI